MKEFLPNLKIKYQFYQVYQFGIISFHPRTPDLLLPPQPQLLLWKQEMSTTTESKLKNKIMKNTGSWDSNLDILLISSLQWSTIQTEVIKSLKAFKKASFYFNDKAEDLVNLTIGLFLP